MISQSRFSVRFLALYPLHSHRQAEHAHPSAHQPTTRAPPFTSSQEQISFFTSFKTEME